MGETQTRSIVSGRNIKQLQLTQDMVTAALVRDLPLLGVGMDELDIRQMVQGMGFDSLQGLTTTASITTPLQFLQTWLPGFIKVITAARKIDVLTGVQTAGSWENEEIVQGILEYTGSATPYSDYGNVPLSSWNTNWERRTIVRFEEGMSVGTLEEMRAGKINVSSAGEKRNSAALALEIQRNRVGFNGFNSGNNRTYGFLNDPNLPAYVTVAIGAASSTTWALKTFLEIVADIVSALTTLRTQSKDTIDPNSTPLTLAVSSAVVDRLATMNVQGTQSVKMWLASTYPNVRVESAPELDAANGGANVFYLYADSLNDGSSDDGRVFTQIVPAKFQVLGVEKRAKSYVEDYANATAGVLLKRPFAVVRRSGV